MVNIMSIRVIKEAKNIQYDGLSQFRKYFKISALIKNGLMQNKGISIP